MDLRNIVYYQARLRTQALAKRSGLTAGLACSFVPPLQPSPLEVRITKCRRTLGFLGNPRAQDTSVGVCAQRSGLAGLERGQDST